MRVGGRECKGKEMFDWSLHFIYSCLGVLHCTVWMKCMITRAEYVVVFEVFGG
ncbi:unnamed protein product [Linum tenue]|uniref:Uncharacterized protein n=1 Tax=Linum tenue TaxID=586396 RepID=A0AAV0JY39_9ROSI|nr:unnamed protein product [Linum tenue]